MESGGENARPWLSVLVPVYAVERYLEACVESVRAQADRLHTRRAARFF